jgi:tetratricopeptide (TPR) repeat protein
MFQEPSSDPRARAAFEQMNRGYVLREAGRPEEALRAWDELLASDTLEAGTETGLVLAKTRHAKAHLLFSLGRPAEAEKAAAEAAAVASQQAGEWGLILVQLNQIAAAIEIDEWIVGAYQASENSELRLRAALAVRHEVAALMSQREQARAIASAKRLVAILNRETDPAQLISVAEAVLSTAATLTPRRLFRGRSTPGGRGQADALIDAVVAQAERVGGAVGAVVVINAKIAAADALAHDLSLRMSYTERVDRPDVREDQLDALRQVQEEAREAGAAGLSTQLWMLRATTLAELDRTDEARDTMDSLIAHLDATGGAAAKVSAVLARGARAALTSQR